MTLLFPPADVPHLSLDAPSAVPEPAGDAARVSARDVSPKRAGRLAPAGSNDNPKPLADCGLLPPTERYELQMRRAAAIVGRHRGLPARQVMFGRSLNDLAARHIAVYLAVTTFEVPKTWAARILRLRRYTIQTIARRIEARRDERQFDAALCRLERECAA